MAWLLAPVFLSGPSGQGRGRLVLKKTRRMDASVVLCLLKADLGWTTYAGRTDVCSPASPGSTRTG